jgi:soluble lytic murein transglycosylase
MQIKGILIVSWKLTLVIVGLFLVSFFSVSAIAGDIEQQRQRFKTAYNHIQYGKKYDIDRLSNGLEDYVLYPYLQFVHLYRNVDKKPEKKVHDFLYRYTGTPMAKRLRIRWLYSLARRKKWVTFLQNYKPDSGDVLNCYQLQARVKTGSVDDALLKDIRAMWLVGKSQVDECDPVFKVLYSSKAMTGDLVWQRFGLALRAGNLSFAGYLKKSLPKNLAIQDN